MSQEENQIIYEYNEKWNGSSIFRFEIFWKISKILGLMGTFQDLI